MTRLSILTLFASASLVAGCADNHSAMHPVGPRARQIADLMLSFFGVSAVVYLIVIAVLVWSLLRRRAKSEEIPPEAQIASADAKSRLVIAGALALTVVTLIGLALGDFFTQRSLTARSTDAVRVQITAHQYWWEIEFDDAEPSQRLKTANELHIPSGKPVELTLTSQDVIHSFWLPSITGKKDLIPGHTNTEVLIVDKPGTYIGQCAEFCGLQHAKMRLIVHADAPETFAAWKRHQLETSRAPATDVERRGREVFVGSSCILCHSIQGTEAGATVGPDLTHLASRGMIAAGTLPNTPSNLASWILSPHQIKPGVLMPATAVPPEDLAALASYLASLQ
jgi:cytochrome c oxidase subunit 2